MCIARLKSGFAWRVTSDNQLPSWGGTILEHDPPGTKREVSLYRQQAQPKTACRFVEDFVSWLAKADIVISLEVGG